MSAPFSGCTGWSNSGRVARHVDDLELDPVRVVEEDRVVAGDVPVLLRAALDRDAASAQPVRPLVDVAPRRRLESDVVDTDAVAVERFLRRRLCLSQTERAARARDVPDRLATLSFH